MFQLGTITDVDSDHNLVQVQYTKSGTVSKHMVPAAFGNSVAGIQYQPQVNDLVFLDDTDGFHVYIVGTYNASTNLQNNLDSGTNLNPGEIIMFAQGGASIYLRNDGSILVNPGTKGFVMFGNPNSPMRNIVRDGDAVTGTDSHGDVINGTVHSSTSTIMST